MVIAWVIFSWREVGEGGRGDLGMDSEGRVGEVGSGMVGIGGERFEVEVEVGRSCFRGRPLGFFNVALEGNGISSVESLGAFMAFEVSIPLTFCAFPFGSVDLRLDGLSFLGLSDFFPFLDGCGRLAFVESACRAILDWLSQHRSRRPIISALFLIALKP